MSTWARRQQRIATDPEFRKRIYGHQVESRRRKRLRAGVPICPHVYRDGRFCWRVDVHVHKGIDSKA